MKGMRAGPALIVVVLAAACTASPASVPPATSGPTATPSPATSPAATVTMPPATSQPTPTPSPAASPAATVSMRDDGCEFSDPAQFDAGTVVLGLENRSSGQFDADLWLLNPGHAFDELAAHIAEEQRRWDAGEPGLGHPTFATLVAEASVTAEHGLLASRLEPGTYGVACILFEGGQPVHIWAAGPFTIAE